MLIPDVAQIPLFAKVHFRECSYFGGVSNHFWPSPLHDVKLTLPLSCGSETFFPPALYILNRKSSKSCEIHIIYTVTFNDLADKLRVFDHFEVRPPFLRVKNFYDHPLYGSSKTVMTPSPSFSIPLQKYLWTLPYLKWRSSRHIPHFK